MFRQCYASRVLSLILVGLSVTALTALACCGPNAPAADVEPVKGALTSQPRPITPAAKSLAAGAEVRNLIVSRRLREVERKCAGQVQVVLLLGYTTGDRVCVRVGVAVANAGPGARVLFQHLARRACSVPGRRVAGLGTLVA